MNKINFGTVAEIWGKAWYRLPNGVFRTLRVGDVVERGDVVLTAQNAIVQFSASDTRPVQLAQAAVPKADGQPKAKPAAEAQGAAASDAERAVEAVERGDAKDAPAAGLLGGGEGALDEGFRVQRIAELLTPASLHLPQDDAALRTERSFETAPEVDIARLSLEPLAILAVEQGPGVAVGIHVPAGSTGVRIDVVPVIGQVQLPDGTPVVAGTVLTPAQLGTLIYVPPADYLPGQNVGTIGYTVSNGPAVASGVVTIGVLPVNDPPLATSGSASGAEDGTVPVALTGTDVDGSVTQVVVTRLPGFGTLLMADGVTPVAVGQVLSAAQAAGLVFRPDANAFGNTSIGFTVVDDSGAVSAPGNFALGITAVNDAPVLAVPAAQSAAEDGALVFSAGNGNAITVADVDGNPLTVTITVSNGAFTLGSTAGVVVAGNGSGTVTLSGPAAAINAALVGSAFHPNADFNGTTTLGVSVNDGLVTTAGSVPLTVLAVADIADDAVATDEDTPIVINVLANDSFEAGNARITAVNGQAITAGGAPVAVDHGSVTLDAAGQLVFTPAPNYNGPANFTYTVASGGTTETAGVAVTVNPVADVATVSLAATPAVAEGGSIVYTATLSTPALTAVNVTLSNGAVITLAAGATSGSIAVAAPADDVYVDAGNVSVTIGSATGGGFDVLNVDPAAAVTAVSDTIDATTVSLTATAAVAEGGTIVYTASLAAPAQTPVLVTLTNGATITIAAGASVGTATVPAPADDAIADAGNVSAAIASATGGNFENLVVDATPATTAVTDTIDTTTVSLTATPSVAEGGAITYTATLTSPAAAAVTITLANGAVLTIATGASSGSVSVPVHADDVYADAGTVSTTIASAVGGNFEALAINPAAATTAVTDTIDTTTVSLAASPSVAEGGTITYTASLTSPAQTTVSVLLSNGATITIAAGASSGSVSVPAPANSVYTDAGSVSATISSASGGNFENLAVNPAAATTAVTDTIDVTTVSLSATPSVAEGGNIVYTASLTSAAQTPVTITLSNGATITIAAGASSGTVSVPVHGDDPYVDAGTVSATISSASGGNFEALAISPAAATTTVTDTIDTTTVSLSATPSVAEGGSIVYTASLTSAAGTAMTVHLSNGATIAIAAGASSGSVSVPAPSEDVYVDAGSVSATITSTSGGNFENLAVDGTAATTSVSDTIDTTTVSISGAGSVIEGASAAYTVSLTSPAQTAVTITLAYSGTAANGSDYNGVATVTIPAGSSSAGFAIAAINDGLAEGSENFTVTLVSATGGNFENLAISAGNGSVTTTLLDNDGTPSISVADTAVVEGGFAVFTVSLSNPSATATTFAPTLASGTATVGTDTASALEYFNGTSWVPVTAAGITIAAGATSVQVRVATIDDALADSGETFTLTATVTAGTTANAAATGTATITDETVPDTVLVSLAGPAAVVEGNATASYTVTLGQAAVTPVTVHLTYSGTATDGSDYTGVATVTIPAGASSASFVIPTLDDVFADSGETIIVTLGAISGGGFEAIAANPAASTVTTTISDETPADVTTVSLAASASVAEGGTITYTATLTNPAQTPVTLTLSNGATITIAAGATSGTVNVPAHADTVYTDAGDVSATISTASGGNFESLAVDPAAAVTHVTDTPNTTTVSLSATPSVAEGGSIVYTAALTNAAQTPVTVTLSNGATITIAAGASTGTVSVPVHGDNVYVDAGSVSATISGASGGNFETLAINPAAATTTVTDTIDNTTVSLSASASVAEGGAITYTASLTSAAQTPVTVTLSNGATITIAAGASSGTVSVPAHADTPYVDAGSVSATISTATGGNFENLVIDPAAATTSVTDTLTATTVSLAATPSVTEGGTIVYTASLTSPALTPVTITLSNGATITIAAGQSTGTVNVPAHADTPYTDAGSVSATISSASGGNFESLVVDPTAATTSVADTLDTTTVSLTATPSVAEGGNIVYTASLTNPAQTPVTVTLANGATITIAAGASSGTVSVPAHADTVYVDNGSVSTTIATATGGNFENLAVSGAAATTTVTDTINVTTVSLTGAPSVAEGATAAYTVSLTSPAQTAVNVTLAYSGTAANGADYTGVATVTIPAGASSATFNIATINDTLAEGTENFTVTLASASGGNFESLVLASGAGAAVTTSIIDDDMATVSLTATPTLTEAGGTIVYTAHVSQAPVSALTVTLSNGATITIAAGATSGTVNVPFAANEDVYLDPTTVSASIASTSGGGIGLAIDPTPAVTTITDTIDATTVSLSASASVAEGGAITYTASLTSAAQTPVTVTLSNGATITIAAGASSGTVSVPAHADTPYVDAGSVSATISTATGGNFENLVIDPAAATTSVTDTLTATTVSLAATPSVTEGGTIVYTASLTSPALTPVTITLSNGATITIAAGQSTGTVNVPAHADTPYTDAGSVSATISSASGGNFESLVVDPTAATTSVADTLDTTTVSLTATPSVAEGGNIVYTASLTNPAQTPVTVTLANGATITIAAGASSGTVSVPAHADTVYVDNGSVSTTIATATGGNFENLAVNPAAATTTVSDTVDTTTVSLTATPSVAEGGDIIYTASLTHAAQTAVSVSLSNGATITIAAGASTGTVSVPAHADNVYADAGSVSATISSASGGNFESLVVNPAAATTSVTDTVNTTTISLTGSASVTEGATGSYTVSLTSPAQTAVTVTLAYSGTAANGSDFNGTTTLTIPAGSSSATFSIATIDDALAEGAESFTVTLASATGGNFEALAISGSAGAVTTTIVDNDVAAIGSVSSASATEATAIVHTVTLTNPSTTATTYTLTLTDGSATGGGVDYTSSLTNAAFSNGVTISGGVITVPAGVTSFTVTVPTSADTIDEPNETYTLNVGGISGTGTIVDDDPTPSISSVSTASQTEGGALVHTVTLSNASSVATTYAYSLGGGSATGGTDYNATPTFSNGVTLSGGVLTVPAGVTSFTVTVASTQDNIDEPNETYNLTVGGVTGIGTIVDDDAAPTVATVTSASATEASNIIHTVTLSNPSSVATTYSLSLVDGSATGGGVDYTSTLTNAAFTNGVTISGGTITVPAGVTSFTVSVPTTGDALNEANETYTLNVGGASGTGTILDDDPAPTLAIDNVTVNEAAGTATFTVTLSAASGQTVSVNYATGGGTATAGSDYTTTSGTLTFAPGTLTRTITVPITNDTLTEATETFNVTLSGAVNAGITGTGVGVGTIIDNDAPPVLDLDANNSSGATGANYATSYTEQGAAVSISDSDISITDPDSVTLTGATITLTNKQAGDALNLPSFPPGITAGVVTTATTITITLSGSASLASYQSAISGITFAAGGGDAPDTTPRTVTVTVTDGTSSSNVGTTTISVIAVNDAPTESLPGAQATNEDTARVFSSANGNAIIVADADSGSVTTTVSVTNGTLTAVAFAGATITANGTGSVTISGSPAAVNGALNGLSFNPTADYNGSATLTVSTNDGVAAPVIGTIGITVAAVADIVNDTVTTNEDTPVTIDVNANDTFENAGHTITAVNGSAITAGGAAVAVANGTVALNAAGQLIFTPTADYNGPASFTYTVTSGGVTETATVNVTVNAVNDAPVNTVPGAQTTAEDTARVFSSANGNAITVADVDGGNLTVTVSVTNGTLSAATFAGATITNNGTGTVTISGTAAAINGALNGLSYAPTADYNGPATMTVSTSDGVAAPVVSTIGLTVTAVADIANDSITTNEDTPVTIDVNANDTFENAGHTITAVNGSAITAGGAAVAVTNGSVTLNAAGQLIFTPAANYNGPASFTYTVTSGGVAETATASVTVNPVNDAPVNTVPGAQTTAEDTARVFSSANGNAITVADVDGGTLTVTVSTSNGTLNAATFAGATITNNGTGTVTISGSAAAINGALNGLAYNPTADYNGAATLTVSTSDGVAAPVVSTVAMTVTAVADIVNDSITTNEDTPVTIDVNANDTFENVGHTITAVNGSAITAGGAAVAVANGSVALNASGQLIFTPTANYNGPASFTYTVTSGGVVETATATVTVNPVNDAPVNTVPGAQTTAEDTARVFSSANGNAITVADVDSGTLTTTVSVTNGTLTAVAFAGATITANGTGTVTISGSPAAVNGALNGLSFNPTADYNGAATLTVSTSDGVAAPVVSTVGITVSAVADITDDTFSTNEDTPVNLNVNSNDSFENAGHQITAINGGAIAVGGSVAVANGSVTLLADGTLNFTPAANYNGAASFTYTVTSGGVTETATVNLTVNPVNDTPVNTVPGAQAVLEDVLTAIGGISVADPDETLGPANNRIATTQLSVSNGTLLVTLTGGAAISAGANGSGTLTLSGTQSAINATLATLKYQVNANYNGGDTLVVLSRDGLGLTDSDTVAITVTPVNDAPSGADKTISLLEDSSYTFVRGDFGFADAAGEGNNFMSVTVNPTAAGTLTLNGVTVTGPTVVTVAQLDSGLLRFAPAANANGNGYTSFTFQVRDDGGTANGGVDTDPTPNTITFNVTAVNDPPLGRDATVTTNEDVPFTFGLGNFAMDDVEQGNGVNPSAVRIDTVPANGSLYLNGVLVSAGQIVSAAAISAGQLKFVPLPDANGTGYANFTFSVQDSAGAFDTAPNTITVNVTPVSDGAPAAGADVFTTTAGSTMTLTLAQLLANDYLPDHARVTGISALAGGGTLVNNGDGTFTFTAPAGAGASTFTYTLTDDDGQTSTATVTLNTVAARDDLATVYESALPAGSGGGSAIATGNVFTNDGGGTSITNVVYNGTTYNAAGGVITVNTALGTLVMQASGAAAGTYTYTLKNAANNSGAGNDLSVTENFQYTSNLVTANLRVGVIDDRPVVYDHQIQVSQVPLPSYSIVLVLDVSGSMTNASGAVRQLNADGTTTITDRLTLAKEALSELVTQYFQQAQNVSVKIVTFSDTATTLNGGAPYTSANAAITAINGITSGGNTNYQAGLDAARAAFGTVDPARTNSVYFLSDGVPNTGNTATGIANYNSFVTANGINSFAVGMGTGISPTTSLDSIHNVDSDGNGTKDPAIIVPDLNDLGANLLSTVPPAFGGNVISNGSSGTVLGADGGFIQTLTVRLDSNGDGTPDTDVTFTFNNATKQITTNGAFLTGFPKNGSDLLTLGAAQGFKYGTLTFSFATGNYTYYTNGLANQGDSFSLRFVAQDGDGDVTPSTALTFNIVNGLPVARPDTDTIGLNDSFADGNVISGLGTDGGLAAGGQLATFSAKGSGADTAVDNAKVTSIAFQGQTFDLTVNTPTTTGTNFTYSVNNGVLTWTGTGPNAGASLTFDESGYYKYTPPTSALTATPHGALITNLFNTSANANANGVSVTGESRTGAVATVNYGANGASVQGGNSSGAVDNLEHLIIRFNQGTYLYGVQDVTINISPASNLLPGGATLTYTVYDVAGNELGQFYSSSEGAVQVPSNFTNIGQVVVEASGTAIAAVRSVSFDAVQLDNAAPAVDPVEIGYTLTDKDGSTSSSTLTVTVLSNTLYGDAGDNVLTGTAADDRIVGGAGNDTLNGGAGADILEGGLGNDTLNGGDGNDLLRGGQGNDVLNGGNGNDVIVGGKGNDTLTGGAGSDVFRWELSDQGTPGAAASDTIADFNVAAKTSGGDVLDLRDLLQGETLAGSATGNLTSYLHFAKVGSDTVIQISSGGGFSGGFNAGAIDQIITLQGVDLTGSGTLSTDQQIIQDLLSKQKLLVDGS
ncbi:MAG: immunoglobulin-like domain-containing protein [Burkholderiaceae bacterium]